MQTTSKKISAAGCLLLFIATFIVPPVSAAELSLSFPESGRVAITVNKQHVVAKNTERNITYNVATTVSQHLIRADDIRLVGNAINPNAQLFIVMTRELSRPDAMGQGYCGAGHEDYLLLVEILERNLLLRDQFLLQSCLKSISMFIDHGDDHPNNGLIHENDGSFSYRLVDDDYDKKRMLTVSAKRFKIDLAPAPEQ
jgi:hypothetical protein